MYLKEEGKPLGEAMNTADKIDVLASNPACSPNR